MHHLPRPQQRHFSAPSFTGERRAGVGVGDMPGLLTDALGRPDVLRTESLTAMCLLIIAACALCFMVYFLRAVLIPFAVAVFLMYLLQPMVNYLCKPPRRWCDKCLKNRGEICCEGMLRVTKSRTYSTMSEGEPLEAEGRQVATKGWGCLNTPLVPRWLAVILAIGIMLTGIITLGLIVYGSVMNLKEDIGKYEEGAERVLANVDKFLRRFDYSISDDLLPTKTQLQSQVPRILKALLSALEYFFLVVIFLVYLLISPVKPIKISVWGVIDLHIRRYIRLKTMVGLLAGAVVTAVLWFLGVSIPHVFGLVTFALHFVPNLGPIIATFLPMPFVIFDPDLPPLYQWLSFLLPIVVHMMIGNFVEPSLFGESFELSPVVVLLGLGFWGSMWGIPGMILAVPIMVIVRIVCTNLDHPYAKMLLRLLAGNVFEPREDDLHGMVPNAGAPGAFGVLCDPYEGEGREEPSAVGLEAGTSGRSMVAGGHSSTKTSVRQYGTS